MAGNIAFKTHTKQSSKDQIWSSNRYSKVIAAHLDIDFLQSGDCQHSTIIGRRRGHDVLRGQKVTRSGAPSAVQRWSLKSICVWLSLPMIPPWAVMKVKGCGLWTVVTKPALSKTASKPMIEAPNENVFDLYAFYTLWTVLKALSTIFFKIM